MPRIVRRLLSLPKLLIAAALAGSLVIALSTVGAISGFTASISNTNNTVATGSLVMRETSPGGTCVSNSGGLATNSVNCTSINKFGGSTTSYPGSPAAATSVTITNLGSLTPATFKLTPGGCTQTTNGTINGTDASFCGKVDLTIQGPAANTCVYPASTTANCPTTPTSAGTLAALPTSDILLTPLAANASATYVFTVYIDPSNATNNDQGLQANETLTWTFST